MLRLRWVLPVAIVLFATATLGFRWLTLSFSDADAQATARQLVGGAARIEAAEAGYAAGGAGTYAVGAGALQALAGAGSMTDVPQVPGTVSAPGAAWEVVPVSSGAQPVVALELDGSRDAVRAVCEEAARVGGGTYGCTRDLARAGTGR